MKYIQNKGRYALSFKISVKGRPLNIELDKRRIYQDTGNIATTGITELEEDVYAELAKNKSFKSLLEKGKLELIDEKELKASTPATDEALVKENKKLVKEAEKAVKAKEEAEAQLSAKDKEINDLKAQLEALNKKDNKVDAEKEKDKADTEADKEAQGF